MSGAPKPLPRKKIFTAPLGGTVRDDELYGGSSDDEGDVIAKEAEQLRNEVKRLQEQVSTLEICKMENENLKEQLNSQEETMKQRSFELDMEKDMHIRRKKAMDDKEFRMADLEEELQSKIRNLSLSVNEQSTSAENMAIREENIGLREVRLKRKEEELQNFQDKLYDREGRLQQNETRLEEKFKGVLEKEKQITEQLQVLDMQRQEYSLLQSVNTTQPSPSPQPQAAAVTSTLTSPPLLAAAGDTENVTAQLEMVKYYEQRRRQEELDQLIALQYGQSGFAEDDLGTTQPPAVGDQPPSPPPDTANNS